MLGVRRTTVTIAARLLQSAGLIYAKANPGGLGRARECATSLRRVVQDDGRRRPSAMRGRIWIASTCLLFVSIPEPS